MQGSVADYDYIAVSLFTCSVLESTLDIHTLNPEEPHHDGESWKIIELMFTSNVGYVR